MSAVTAMLRGVGKVAAGAAPTVLVAELGLPALGGLIFLAVLVLGVTCWVIGSEDRTEPGQPGAARLEGRCRLPGT